MLPRTCPVGNRLLKPYDLPRMKKTKQSKQPEKMTHPLAIKSSENVITGSLFWGNYIISYLQFLLQFLQFLFAMLKKI